MENNYFIQLNNINVGEKIEKKNGLSYLSWAWAWGEIKKIHPSAIYTIYENKDGWNYHTDGKTGWVKTGVTINEIEHIEYLPIMDLRNKSIVADNITSFDVNKAIQRSLTKAVARHGLGLYIYAGEDLPESETEEIESKPKETIKETITEEQLKEFEELEINIAGAIKYYKLSKIEDMEKSIAQYVINTRRKKLSKNKEVDVTEQSKSLESIKKD